MGLIIFIVIVVILIVSLLSVGISDDDLGTKALRVSMSIFIICGGAILLCVAAKQATEQDYAKRFLLGQNPSIQAYYFDHSDGTRTIRYKNWPTEGKNLGPEN
jgi:hypothetical protein